jgi:hypothetical protein
MVKDEIRTLAPFSLFNYLYLVMVATGASDQPRIHFYVRLLKFEDGFEFRAGSNVDSDSVAGYCTADSGPKGQGRSKPLVSGLYFLGSICT